MPSIDESVTEGAGLRLADTLGGPDPRLDLVVDSQVLRGLLAGLPARDQQIVQLSLFRRPDAVPDRWSTGHLPDAGVAQLLLKSALGRLRVQMDAAA